MSNIQRTTITVGDCQKIYANETIYLAPGEVRHYFGEFYKKSYHPIGQYDYQLESPSGHNENDIDVFDIALTDDGHGINFSVRTITKGVYWLRFLCHHSTGEIFRTTVIVKVV